MKVLLFLAICCFSVSAFADPVVIGSKKFTESVILGEVAKLAAAENKLEASHTRELGGTRVLWNALVRGDITAYPEYSGTIAAELFQGKFEATDWEAMRSALRSEGIGMSEPLGFENTYAIGVLAERAKSLGLKNVSDLNAHPELKFGVGNEFLNREDGWPGLRGAYDMPHTDVTGMDHDLAYKALASSGIDAMDVYTTDAEIVFYDMTVLKDDKRYFPKYDAVFLYRLDAPDVLQKTLDSFAGKITADTMRKMNHAVKIGKQKEAAVAADFLGADAATETEGLAERVWVRTLEHLQMVAISLVAALLISLPLGILAFRRKRIGAVVLAATGVLQTIPSLALLVFMIPLLGIGTTPAIAALFLYSLLPIVRGTHVGFVDIDPNLRRAADAIGMTSFQKLRHVELPMALRSILSGVKTAAVINVGTATLGALIGAGGYGQPILTGIRLDDTATILEGAIPAAVLALIVQWSFDLLERFWVSPGLRT